MKKINKGYKLRLYPNKEQIHKINQTLGCSNFIWNHFLALNKELYKNKDQNSNEKHHLDYYAMSKEITRLKTQPEFSWLKDVSKWALQNFAKDLHNAYLKLFTKQGKQPRFKSKKNDKRTYKINCSHKGEIDFKPGFVKIPKLGWVKCRGWHELQGRILNATIEQKPSGRYHISVCCEQEQPAELSKTGKQVGLDLGLTSFATQSDGQVITNPRFYERDEKRLAFYNRELSRKVHGSKNWWKAKNKLGKVYEKISNRKADFVHKLTSSLVKEFDFIAVETLNVAGMMKNPRLSKHIQSVSWSNFINTLAYKARWYGKQLVQIDTFFASSQLCSACGTKNEQVKDLSVRQWTCDCGAVHDRDLNAAKNILNEGLKQATN